jgi:hypothetical protein
MIFKDIIEIKIEIKTGWCQHGLYLTEMNMIILNKPDGGGILSS